MAITDVRDALLMIIDHVYHYKAPERDADGNPLVDRYVVWGETGADGAVNADDRAHEISVTGELYYYTKEEYDSVFDDICQSLTECGISWTLESIGYDDSTGQIVYSLSWEVACGAGSLYKG